MPKNETLSFEFEMRASDAPPDSRVGGAGVIMARSAPAGALQTVTFG